MPAIVNCPKCDAQVSLPVGANPVWRVRCPLCQKEFPLAEALDKAPPELIVVDRASVAGVGTPPWTDHRAAAAEDVATLPDIEIALDNGLGEISEADATTQSADAGNHLPLDVANDYNGVNGLSTQRVPHSTRGGHHWIGRLTGIVGGGVLGLMLGYFALLWLGGPSRDFLNVGSKLPSFILPAEFDRTVAMRRDQSNGTSPAPAANGDGHRSPPDTIQSEPTSPRPPLARSEDPNPVEQAEMPGGFGHLPRAVPEPNREPITEPPWPEGHAATPVRPATGSVSLGPAFSVSEVDSALKRARNARDVLASNRLTDARARPAMGTAYRELCNLAAAVTHPAAGIDHRQRRVAGDLGDLVLQLAQEPTKRDELARIADHWIDASQRTGDGIVLAGRVEAIHRVDASDLHELRISLSGKRTVTVLSSVQPSLRFGDQAVVLGSIVNRPAADSAASHGGDQVTVQSGVIRRLLDEPTPDSA